MVLKFAVTSLNYMESSTFALRVGSKHWPQSDAFATHDMSLCRTVSNGVCAMSDLFAASQLTEPVDDSSPTSSWHSAFDPPGSPTPTTNKKRKTKKPKKKKRKEPRKTKKVKKHKKQVKAKRMEHEQPPTPFRPSRACAKMLVQVGLCSCHFMYVSQCPIRSSTSSVTKNT